MTIDDDAYYQLKAAAARLGTTMAALTRPAIQQAAYQALLDQYRTDQPTPMPDDDARALQADIDSAAYGEQPA